MKLQFSLRGLLLLMAIVGAALAFYRWPWKETKVNGVETIATEYRRNWNGKAVKHGVQVKTTTLNPVSSTQAWYSDDELRRRCSLLNGVVVNDTYYRDGKAHGPYLAIHGSRVVRGQYHQGKKVGSWQQSHRQVLQNQKWRNDQLHGRRTWTTPEGRLLHSAEYEAGRLIRWNGQPADAELRRLVTSSVTDADLQRWLLEMFSRRDECTVMVLGGELLFAFGNVDLNPVLRFNSPYPAGRRPVPGPLASENLLEHTLDRSLTLVYRFERFEEVQIIPQELDWQDRTGLNSIRLEAGSSEEQYWLGRGVVSPFFAHHKDGPLKGLLYAENGYQLQVDTTAVEGMHSSLVPSPNQPLWHRRTRRAIVGQYLDQCGFYCEMRGNVLVIKPHPETVRRHDGAKPFRTGAG